MPSYAALLPVRALTVLGAAVFTPQAAAAIGAMAAPEHRGGAITFIFLGWSLASVVGIPAAAWLGDTFGWRCAFSRGRAQRGRRCLGLRRRAGEGASGGAVAGRVARRLRQPRADGDGRRYRPLRRRPVHALLVLRAVLQERLGASTGEASALFIWFGIFGVVGNVVASRYVDRIGADRAASACSA